MRRRAARAPRPDPKPAPPGVRDPDGEVAEWSKAPHSKCGVRATVPWVRIPPSPPPSQSLESLSLFAGEFSPESATLRAVSRAQRGKAGGQVSAEPDFSLR